MSTNDPKQKQTGYWEEEVDPDRQLSLDERYAAINNLRAEKGLPPMEKGTDADDRRLIAYALGGFLLLVAFCWAFGLVRF